MAKPIASIERIIDDGAEFICYTYEDGSSAQHPILWDGQRLYIEVKGTENHHDDVQKFIVIKDQAQVQGKLNVKNYDFSQHIFLCEVDFSNHTFEKLVAFVDARFAFGAIFYKARFGWEADFAGALFGGNANFVGAQFDMRANFSHAQFNGVADFHASKFGGDANFTSSQLKEGASFTIAQFNQIVYFASVKSSQYAPLLLSYAKFEKILVLGVEDIGEPIGMNEVNTQIHINLLGCQVNAIQYGSVRFVSDSRETFLVLKNVAIKQNDNIRALHFHYQDMGFYYQSLLKSKGRYADKIILSLEKWVSDFGTKPFRVLGLLLLWNTLFIGGYAVADVPVEHFVKTLFVITALNVDEFACSAILGAAVAVQFFGNVFFVYELQKSFRKFSRKL